MTLHETEPGSTSCFPLIQNTVQLKLHNFTFRHVSDLFCKSVFVMKPFLQLHSSVELQPQTEYLLQLQRMMYILHGMGNNWALWKVQGQSSQLILSPLAGAAHRSERRRPLISPTSSRCSAREREECK